MRLARPVHPGEMLNAFFIEEQSFSIEQVASSMEMPVSELEKLLDSQLPVDKNMAVKLSYFSGISAKFWLNLQRSFDAGSNTSNFQRVL